MSRKRPSTTQDKDGPPQKKTRWSQSQQPLDLFQRDTTCCLVQLGWPSELTHVVNAYVGESFRSSWIVPVSELTLSIPGTAVGWAMIDWGDGHHEVVSKPGKATIGHFEHNYDQQYAGQQVNICIVGRIIDFSLLSLSTIFRHSLQSIQDWGSITLRPTQGFHFFGCRHLISLPIDSRSALDGVKSMASMFAGATSLNCDLTKWNVSSVTNMESMFKGARSFNSDLSGWDVSLVTNMDSMFEGACSFNGDLGGWNVSPQTTTKSIFKNTPVNHIGWWS